MIELLISELKFNAYTLQVNLDGISNAQSEVQPKSDVNSVKWILSHLIQTRMDLFSNLGLNSEVLSDIEEMKLSELYLLFDKTQENLNRFLNENKDIGDDKAMVITKYMLHESYHIGQIGYCRRFLGLTGALY